MFFSCLQYVLYMFFHKTITKREPNGNQTGTKREPNGSQTGTKREPNECHRLFVFFSEIKPGKCKRV